jgi:hypothetical protein
VIKYSNSEDEIQAFNMFWPYLVVKGMSMNLLVFNANNRDKVHSIIMPNHLVKISRTYITELYDLYIFGDT